VFADTSLARGIEAAEARLTRAAAQTIRTRDPSSLVVELGAGVAVASGEGSPIDKVIGIGFEPLDWPAFDRFEHEALALGRSVRVELATLADPTIARTLTSRGFELQGFENLLGRRLDAGRASRDAGECEVAVVDRAGGGLEAWIETINTGFLHPDVYDGPPPPDESFDRDVLQRVLRDMTTVPGFVQVIARRGGNVAGGASMRIDGDIAQLTGAATLPEHRRRGVQSALLARRLTLAADAGCGVAVVTTAPGSKSQQNVMRAGFSLLYARAVLVKAPTCEFAGPAIPRRASP
jgi:ribosomal protein S18 acetylase RimI-like enzyme